MTLSGGPVGAIAEKIAPLALDVRADAPARINLLIPTIDLEHFFAGYIAKFNLALALARRGHRVRIVTVDRGRGAAARMDAHARVLQRLGRPGGARRDRIRQRAARRARGEPADSFIATTWWTAHIAECAAERDRRASRFLYLIQEYEPFTFPMGTYAALARQSYDASRTGRCSRPSCCATTSVRTGSASTRPASRRGDGIERGVRERDHGADTARPSAALAARGGPRRLLFYARPEPHAARNLFELGVLALAARGRRRLLPGRLGAARRSAPCRARRGSRSATGSRCSSAPSRTQSDYARMLTRARPRAGADVHPAPEPRAARDGVGRDADGDQQLRDQDRRRR